MVNAREWLDRNYPNKPVRQQTKELNVKNQNLEGYLDLRDFVILEKLDCSRNQLTGLNISNCPLLVELQCSWNKLASLDLSKNSKLGFLDININNISGQTLSLVSHLTQLTGLYLERNHFIGSLKPLQKLKQLEWLNIVNADLDTDGLEYLPESLTKLFCTGWCAEQLKDYGKSWAGGYICYNYQTWRQNRLYSYLVNKVETRGKEINFLQEQLTGNQTIIDNLKFNLSEVNLQLNSANSQLVAWKNHLFLPRSFHLDQPNSLLAARTQVNLVDALGIIVPYCLYRGYKWYKERKNKKPTRKRTINNQESEPLIDSELEGSRKKIEYLKPNNNSGKETISPEDQLKKLRGRFNQILESYIVEKEEQISSKEQEINKLEFLRGELENLLDIVQEEQEFEAQIIQQKPRNIPGSSKNK